MKLALNSSERLRWMLAIAAVVGFVASYWYYLGCRARAADAISNLRVCQQLAAEITVAQQAPRNAAMETRTLEDLGSLVETAAKQSGLPVERVLRIDPRGSRRLAKSDYVEQATEIELHNVDLQQLVTFVFGVTEKDEQLQIGTLRLRVPHESKEVDDAESWLAEVILTQRIYAPTTAHP